ncbi:MAG: hypothetical protein R3Y60_03810 [bacterium]
MANLEKLEGFTVYCSSILSQEDINVLTLLYNPLIKKDAYNVYMLLSSLVERASLKSFTGKHQFLFDMTLLNSEEFYDARIKLEAVGLLKTLYNDSSYVYVLKPPFTAKQFLVDGILGTFLHAEIGQASFKHLFKLFNVPKIPTGFNNITKNFDDVFTTDVETIKVETEEHILGRNLNTGIKVKNFSFNYEKFISIVKLVMDDKKRNSKKIETHLTNIAYAYGFDEESLANVYRQSIDASGNLDYGMLNKNALDEFHFQYNKGVPKMVQKNEDEFYKTLSSLTADMILKKYSKFKQPLVDDVKKIALIYQEFDSIDRAVLNLSILSVLKLKNGDVPAFNYFKAAINTLIKNELTNFDDAKRYYFGEIKSNTDLVDQMDKPKKVIAKNSKNPKWLNDALDNIMDGVETL